MKCASASFFFFFFSFCASPQFKYILCRAHKSSARHLNRYMMTVDVKINMWWLKSRVQSISSGFNLNPSCSTAHIRRVILMLLHPRRTKRPRWRKDSFIENLLLLPVSPLGHGAAVRLTSVGLWLWPSVHCGGKDDSRATHACSDCSPR